MPELPREIWVDRLENEIKNIKHLNALEEDSIVRSENSIELIINIKALGFVLRHSKDEIDVIPKKSHRIFLKINRAFPYPGGIDFSWYSNIFHPNIHSVELPSSQKPGTGYICLNILKKWSRLSDLETTVNALQKLVENPNPDDPLKYDICLKAKTFFEQNTMEDLKKQYGYEEREEEEEDIIIIED